MNIQTKTSIIYVLELTEQDLTDALIAPAALQEALRAARATHRATNDTRPSNISYGTRAPYRMNGDAIARAAKKQNKQLKKARAKSFLADPGGTFACPDCDKMFDSTAILNRHRGRMHKSSNGKMPAVHTVNTFPMSVLDAD